MSSNTTITPLGKAFMLVLLGALATGGYMLTQRGKETAPQVETSGAVGPAVPATATEITFSFGTEKKTWVEWAAAKFAETPEGRGVRLRLLPTGSLEGAREAAQGNQPVHLFSPASSSVKDMLVSEWQTRHGRQPILREEILALTPMVFICWKERADAFLQKYQEMNFDTLSQALSEPTGWAGIASQPNWGFFKFGCPDPITSNGGLTTLLLMGHAHFNKTTPLSNADVVDPAFQTWFKKTATSMNGRAGSTGTMMRDMVLRGPSAFDVIFAYESVAIDYLQQAAGRWGELRIIYPKLNMWSDNPCYLLDQPGASVAQKAAADAFLNFLLTPVVQQQAFVHGLRPGNTSVSVNGVDSPFVKHASKGLRLELPTVCDASPTDVLLNLQTAWQRLLNR